jgi:peroxiredoxin
VKRRLAWIALAAVTAAASAGCKRAPKSAAAAFRPLEVGAAVPAYMAVTLQGDTIRLGGSEPVTLVNVWATWCESCREEMAALDSLHQSLGPRGLRVIGVSVDQGTAERVRRFVDALGLRFATAHDPSGDIEKQFAVMGVPTTFVIARDGRLIWRHTGNISGIVGEVRTVVDSALLAGQSATH